MKWQRFISFFLKSLAFTIGIVTTVSFTTISTRAANAWHVSGVPSVISQPVEFHNAGATLRGTLYRPDTLGRAPAVVVLHAAGIGDANAALYDHLRAGLPQIGIAVLVFDRRGTGRSSHSLYNASYETLADDGVAGARAIAKLAPIDPQRIGYWGLSQGGWLAVLAADRDPAAAFAVSVSAPLVTPEMQMEFAMSNRLRIDGYSNSDVQAMLAARKAWTGYLRGVQPRADAVRALSKIDHRPWFDLMYMPSALELTRDPSTSPWRKEMDDDPAAAVRNAKVPSLFVYGGRDPWINVRTSIDLLSGIARAHSNVSYAVIAGASHEMMFVKQETMDSSWHSLQVDAPQAPAYFTLLGSWLTQHTHSRQK